MPDIAKRSELVLNEQGIVYPLNGEFCLAVYHAGHLDASTGVLIVVGGRQYRVGAHRQFVLLARALAQAGFPVLRFDVRGMGDSGGDIRHFLDTGQDLCAARDILKKQAPDIKRVVVWGLCDGATATVMSLDSLQGDDGVSGLMLVNPWVTTDSGAAKVQIKHYYQKRLLHKDFWRKLIGGKLDVRSSTSSLLRALRISLTSVKERDGVDGSADLPMAIFDNLESFTGKTSVVVSNSDLTAMEFFYAYRARYKGTDATLNRIDLTRVDADHTFSGERQHERLVALTLEFVTACNECK